MQGLGRSEKDQIAERLATLATVEAEQLVLHRHEAEVSRLRRKFLEDLAKVLPTSGDRERLLSSGHRGSVPTARRQPK